MADELRIFENEAFGQVRTVMIDDEPWFVGRDVAAALGYKNTKDALASHVEDCDKIMGSQNATPSIKDSMGREQYPTWINESGMYALIFGSKLDRAKEFKRWVTSEVLPTLRKTGGYVSNSDLFVDTYFSDVPYAQRELVRGLVMNIEAQQKSIEEMKPKALFHDAVALAKNSVSIGDLSKILKQNGISIGRNRLFNWLRDNGYLMKHGYLGNNMPTQKSMERKLFRVKQYVATDPMGFKETRYITLVTPKGQQYFVDKFLSSDFEEAV